MRNGMDGSELRRRRKAMKLTQAELGDEIGLSRDFVGQMERDVAVISPRTAAMVAHLYEQVTGVQEAYYREQGMQMAFDMARKHLTIAANEALELKARQLDESEAAIFQRVYDELDRMTLDMREFRDSQVARERFL